jgi:alcohol dehydrogenase (NADP+)
VKTFKLNSGHNMPLFGLGTWLSVKGEVYNIVKEAIKLGYRHIDCAHCYENEDEIGVALEEVISEGIVKRSDLFITSKLWNNSHKKEDVIPALKKSLEDLKLDYLDLYLIHWPVAFKSDVFFATSADGYLTLDEAPISNTWKELEKAVDMGLIKSIGVANFSESKIKKIQSFAKLPLSVNQVERHPYFNQEKLNSFCKSENILMTSYSPFGSPGRSDAMKKEDEPTLLDNKTLVDLAKKHNVPVSNIIIAWSLNQNISVIPKTVTPSRAKENLDSTKLELSKEDIELINSLDMDYRYVDGSFFTSNGSPYTMEDLWG